MRLVTNLWPADNFMIKIWAPKNTSAIFGIIVLKFIKIPD